MQIIPPSVSPCECHSQITVIYGHNSILVLCGVDIYLLLPRGLRTYSFQSEIRYSVTKAQRLFPP
jgi:hypothetical protein